MGQNVTNRTIFQPSLSSGSGIQVSSGFEFVADNKIQFTGKPGETSNLTLKIPGTDTGASIGIELASCPPGYIIDDVSSICVCSASQNNKSLVYRGIVGCKENKGVAISGYWVGYILSDKNEKPNQMNLYTSDCPLGFCHIKASNGKLMHHMVVSVNGAVEFQPTTIRDIYIVIYNIFNLNFFDIDELSFCLWKGASTLDIISIKLKGKQCCKSTSSYSVVQGLTAFLVISYFQCSHISFILLTKGTLHGIGGSLYRPLVFWDGSLEYFSPHHLQYAIPALISLIIFVLPFPLILTFDGLLLKVESKLAICFAFIRRLMPWTAIHYKLKPLLDSFQGPFKDQYLVLVVFLAIQAMAQPFQEKSHNICALLVFTNMALINAFTMRIYYLVSNYGYTAETITMQWIQMGLIYVPLAAAVLMWLICPYIVKI
uniref:Uncharacterized protein n=1 Tax=Amphimedon queenslandica TaxID=400682 RepID=A0A1X7VCE8_AMPQE